MGRTSQYTLRSIIPAVEDSWRLPQPTSPCFVFQGQLTPKGYAPQRKRKGIMKLAYRWAYEDAYGVVPSGLQLDHLCNYPACIRPDHLEAVTPAENNRRRGLRKGRCSAGHLINAENSYMWFGGRNGQAVRKCRLCYKKVDRLRKGYPAEAGTMK